MSSKLVVDKQSMMIKTITTTWDKVAFRYPIDEEVVKTITPYEQDMLSAAVAKIITNIRTDLYTALCEVDDPLDLVWKLKIKIIDMQQGSIHFARWLREYNQLDNSLLESTILSSAGGVYIRLCQVYWVVKMLRMAKQQG